MATLSANPLRALLVLVGGLVVSSCGTEAPLTPQAPQADAASSPTTNDDSRTGEAGAPQRCDIPTVPSTDEAEVFEQLSAQVVDVDGDAVADQLAQACGLDVCLARTTNAAGEVDIRPQMGQPIRRVAFKYGDGLRFAQFALLLDAEQSHHELGTQRTLALPASGKHEPLRAGSRASSSGARLEVDASANVRFDLLSFPDEQAQAFVAAVWPQAEPLPEAAQDLGFVALWALGPLKTEFCPPARLALPNTAALAPGTEVELLLHVTDVSAAWGEYGTWNPVARARVNQDGSRLETLDDSGIPQLGTLGLRIAQ